LPHAFLTASGRKALSNASGSTLGKLFEVMVTFTPAVGGIQSTEPLVAVVSKRGIARKMCIRYKAAFIPECYRTCISLV